jgi:methylthioribose-1-phosphate isomerase
MSPFRFHKSNTINLRCISAICGQLLTPVEMDKSFTTLEWQGDVDGHLVLLDQTRLPDETAYLDCHTVEDVWQAIRRLSVRGAPVIGVAAAYGVYLGAAAGRDVNEVCDYLATSRPTAVNLFCALARMRTAASRGVPAPVITETEPSPNPSLQGRESLIIARLLAEARVIHQEEREQSAAMARYGADLLNELPAGVGILTHCNAGALVSTGDGTALAVIFELARRGKRPHVWADETRPLLQGARLTMWELQQHGIEATLICDSTAAQVMREGRIQAVITGADRIAANGDTANKIGTFSVATLARAFGIPFYVVAPATTFDLALAGGDDIPIEQRGAEEITCGFGKQTAPSGIEVYNPAFDVTPAELITAIITDRGVIQPVDLTSVRRIIAI